MFMIGLNLPPPLSCYANLRFLWVLEVLCGAYNAAWEFVEDDWFYGYRGILLLTVVFVVHPHT